MGHLSEINKTYFEHLVFAWITAIQLLEAAVVLLFHGLAPDILCKAGSEIVQNVHLALSQTPGQDRILVRFNTKWEQDPEKRQWRILINGHETLAHQVVMLKPCKTIEEPVEGVQKFHFETTGQVTVDANYIGTIR